MVGIIWVLVPSVVFGALGLLLLPDTDPPARWRAWVRRCARRAVRPVTARVEARRRRRPVTPDPFEVLSLQVRLGLLADQLRALEADPHVYARARRQIATRAAYDALLAEACALAGVDLDETAPRTEPERFREEMELASRGWSW